MDSFCNCYIFTMETIEYSMGLPFIRRDQWIADQASGNRAAGAL
jgi:hypothetical protein